MEFVESTLNCTIAHQHIWSTWRVTFFSWIPLTLGKSRQIFRTPTAPVISQIGLLLGLKPLV